MKSLDTAISAYREPLTYSDEKVPEELLKKLLNASRQLPYAFYLQPTRYHIVTEQNDGLYNACFKQPLVKQAPAIIIFTADRLAAKDAETLLDQALAANEISIEDAEQARSAITMHFEVSPLGLGWLGKLVGAPLLRLFTAMPQLACVHKREFLTRQVMRSVMSFLFHAQAEGLSCKIIDNFDEWRVKTSLNIPWHQIVVSVMSVGYAKKYEKVVTPVSLDEVIYWNKV